MGFREVVLELDSRLVLQFIQEGLDPCHSCFSIVWQCHQLLARDWILQLKHVYKESNRVADWLAYYALGLDLVLHEFNQPPCGVLSLLLQDISGACLPPSSL